MDFACNECQKVNNNNKLQPITNQQQESKQALVSDSEDNMTPTTEIKQHKTTVNQLKNEMQELRKHMKDMEKMHGRKRRCNYKCCKRIATNPW